MENKDRKKVADFYDRRIKEHGDSHLAVGWKSAAQQRFRFDVLLRGAPAHLGRVLDLGCGSGDLLGYLKERHLDFDSYLGVDLSPMMVKVSSEKYADENATFLVGDISNLNIDEKFDTVFMSGALNIKTTQLRVQRLEALFKSISKVSTQGARFAMNFLSTEVDYEEEVNQHYERAETSDIARRFSSSVEVLENYGLYEFTVIGEIYG